MTCAELRESYELYALGVAEEPERSEIAAHLARDCDVCVPGVRKAMEAVSSLAAVAPSQQPRKSLRRRILASAGHDSRGWMLWPAWAAVCAALAVALFVVRGDLQRERERSRAVLEFLRAPETREATFGEGKPEPAKGRVFVNAGRGVLLLASNLGDLPANRTYQFWLLPRGGKPVPAGLFRSTAGEALHLYSGSVNLGDLAGVAVSVEPEGGSPQPTTTPILVVTL